jgi:hypothetical protein
VVAHGAGVFVRRVDEPVRKRVDRKCALVPRTALGQGRAQRSVGGIPTTARAEQRDDCLQVVFRVTWRLPIGCWLSPPRLWTWTRTNANFTFSILHHDRRCLSLGIVAIVHAS